MIGVDKETRLMSIDHSLEGLEWLRRQYDPRYRHMTGFIDNAIKQLHDLKYMESITKK